MLRISASPESADADWASIAQLDLDEGMAGRRAAVLIGAASRGCRSFLRT
jgi:hypothetical protein